MLFVFFFIERLYSQIYRSSISDGDTVVNQAGKVDNRIKGNCVKFSLILFLNMMMAVNSLNDRYNPR